MRSSITFRQWQRTEIMSSRGIVQRLSKEPIITFSKIGRSTLSQASKKSVRHLPFWACSGNQKWKPKGLMMSFTTVPPWSVPKPPCWPRREVTLPRRCQAPSQKLSSLLPKKATFSTAWRRWRVATKLSTLSKSSESPVWSSWSMVRMNSIEQSLHPWRKTGLRSENKSLQNE